MSLACENIRFSSLFAAGAFRVEERGETDVFACDLSQKCKKRKSKYGTKMVNAHLITFAYQNTGAVNN